MASEVFSTEVVTLLDGTEVELRPLAIAKLRKFMRMWQDHIKVISEKLQADMEKEVGEREFTEAEMTDAQFDIFIKMCALGLETQLKEGKTDKQFLAHLEEVLDEATIYRILLVTGNLKLGEQEQDPNPPTPALTGLTGGKN
jgi:hypothetical protein